MTHYLAAPLSAPTADRRAWHRDRAILAGELLGADIIPHRDIAPRFAPRWVEEGETEDERAAAMAECLRMVSNADELTLLYTPDGLWSPGCRVEYDAWHGAEPSRRGCHVSVEWSQLRPLAVWVGRMDEWRRLWVSGGARG